MPNSRPRLAVPLMVLAVLALMLTAIAPVLAAPSGTAGSRLALTDHILPGDCDVIVLEGDGDILVNGVALTVAQLALLDADALAALQLAAAADASAAGTVCVNVTLGVSPPSVVVDADIELRPVTVDINADGDVALDGDIVLDAGLFDADMIAALMLAADAGATVCVTLTIEDNVITVALDAVIELCPATVGFDTDGNITLNGVVISGDLLGADLTDLLTAAATANVDVCVVVTITDDGLPSTWSSRPA